MKPTYIALMVLGGLLEILGILTLITNPETVLPHVELGFQVPALISPTIQGVMLFFAGSGLTLLAIMNLQQLQR